MQLIGILGGTFDPIHNGHISLALEALKQLELDQVRLIPVNIPPHRNSPVASADQRHAMIELAISYEPEIHVDLRELDSNEISYTINTLKSLRQEFKSDALCLIMGRDAFNKIDSWKDWQSILDYVHIIVANRPGELTENNSSELNNWIELNKTNDLSFLSKELNGKIIFIDIPEVNISSSMIREFCSKQKNIDDLVPFHTQTYIQNSNLYLDTA